MTTPVKVLWVLLVWMVCVYKRAHCFYFTVENEPLSENSNIQKCYLEHYVNFKGQIVQVCLDQITSSSVTRYNIFINAFNEKRKWERKLKIIDNHTRKMTRYFYSFISNDELIVIYCFNKNLTQPPYECHRITTNDMQTIKNKEKINLDFKVFETSSLTDYSSDNLQIDDHNYILICGVNNKRNSHGKNTKMFVLCQASSDNGVSWRLFNFQYTNVSSSWSYQRIVPKISGNEIGFKYFSPNISLSKYIKCRYKKENDFECTDVDLVRSNSYMWDIVKVKGYYVSILSNSKKPPCYLYYMYNNTYLIPLEAPKSIGNTYNRGNLFQLDNSRVVYNYMNENGSYTYLLKHNGTNKFCTLLYIKREYMNPGFVKNGNNTYNCKIMYDDLPVQGDERYLTIGAYSRIRSDVRKCFLFRYDDSLEPVSIVHKILLTREYKYIKLYSFYIKKDIENYFMKDITLECYLGEGFYLTLYINFKNNYILDNTDNNNKNDTINLYNNNLIYYKLPPNTKYEDIMTNTNFPDNTKYIKVNDNNYIFKLPPYIKNKIKTQLFFINTTSNKIQNKNIIIHEGGKQTNVIGVDFSNRQKICSYGNNTQDNCDKIKINENKIFVNVNTNTNSEIILGLICPVHKKNKNTCFNEIYENKKKKFIRDFFKDYQGLLTVYPKTYLYKPGIIDTYEESTLIMTSQFLENYKSKKDAYNNSFLCKCYANSTNYEITFNLE
ncbi:6-cysteine protein, putative [Plasmodium malariae]|uniref:6-cysteine protein n=1 Tax=Plasmodium malariae TaxID=5858 RepID=A0A1A8W5D8_PLAMA|nr:6-cysteine protein, putative [Plasmodium malariae]SBS86364.1 6-cysteine protein [Plasmodium malariae]SCN44918.1 6-cysteine protein, putative [Plasmodium malariae]